MKLYGSNTSPFVRHCRIALLQSGFDFELKQADYAKSAQESPSRKVPYFKDDQLFLTDSSTIIKYVREKSGQGFLNDIQDFENFTLVNTLLDSAINLFLLENEGITSEQAPYLSRQKDRIESGLIELNNRFAANTAIKSDSAIRCACFIDWGLFRHRIKIDSLGNLQSLLEQATSMEEFQKTSPY